MEEHAVTAKLKKLQACFVEWLAENSPRFVAPPVMSSHTSELIELVLHGDSATITARLTRQRLTASIGTRAIIDLDLPTGIVEYSCGLISPAVVTFYETVEAAWAVQFDRFLQAVNRRLVEGRPQQDQLLGQSDRSQRHKN